MELFYYLRALALLIFNTGHIQSFTVREQIDQRRAQCGLVHVYPYLALTDLIHCSNNHAQMPI